jgi:hypothetical protein
MTTPAAIRRTVGHVLHAAGIGRAQTPPPQRPIDRPLLGSLVLQPWQGRMRFGWVLRWNGPYWRNTIGIAGPDWNNGEWLGGMSWNRYGPLVICRSRRRGSLRSDRRFARAMGCTCTPTGLLWPISHPHPTDCPAYIETNAAA